MQKTFNAFHFIVSHNNKIIMDSQDKKGFAGFRTSFRARNEAALNIEQLPTMKELYRLNVFPVFYEQLPDMHPAMLLMADKAMQDAEDQSVDYTQLHVTSEKVNQ
jgi:hypothetical protein